MNPAPESPSIKSAEPLNTVDFIKNYFAFVGGSALVWGLVINSPNWEPVKVVPLNPIAMVNAQDFKARLAKRESKSITFDQIQQHLGIDISDGKQRRLVFPIMLYDQATTSKLASPRQTQSVQRDFTQELIWNSHLKDAKRAFGIMDPDLDLEEFGQVFGPGENHYSLDELRRNPSRQSMEAFFMERDAEVNYTANTWAHNPFYSLFEKAKSKVDKMQLYKSLQESTTFYSLYAVVNDGYQQATDLVIRVNPPPHFKWRFLQDGLVARRIGVEAMSNGAHELTIESLRSGPKDYKLVGIVSRENPAKREMVYLVKKGPVRQVAEYWKYLLSLPLLFLGLLEIRRQLAPYRASILEKALADSRDRGTQ